MCDDEFSSQPTDQVVTVCSENNCDNNWHNIQKKVDEIMKDEELEEIDKAIVNETAMDKNSSWYDNSHSQNTRNFKDKRVKFLIERNKRITEVYKTTAQKNPENRWAKLASYVSAQAGCGMEETQGFQAQSAGSWDQSIPFTNRRIGYGIDPDKALNALSEANREIFSSVGMPFMFISEYGYEEFYKCAKTKKPPVDEDIIKAAREMEAGELDKASNRLAEKEQLEIVEPIYKKYHETFRNIDYADTHEPPFYDNSRDRQSIALEYECDEGEKIKLGNLQLKNKDDRVKYYQKLMNVLEKK